MDLNPVWPEIQAIFDWDGSLRDLYIVATTLPEWQRVLDYLHQCPYQSRFSLANQPALLPTQIGLIAPGQGDAHRLLAIDLGGILLNCHFSIAEEIEFDLDPREITSATHWKQLLTFMLDLAQWVGQEVILTRENWPRYIFCHCRPTGEVLWEHVS